MKFTDLGLSEALLKAVLEEGYSEPTPIQAQAIPAVLEGHDIMASAQTGTGKTAGFTLPLLHKLADMPRARGNHTRALILTPTRELAAQVHASIETYGRYLNLRSAVVFGGVKINPQMMKLRSGVEILVATPGRLLDLYQQNAIRFDEINTLVLDEADRMLDMGFIHDIRKILALLPKQRQNLLFSATYSKEIQTLAKGLLHAPVQISVTPVNTATELVEQTLYLVDKARKTDLLKHLIKSGGWYQALVFSRTKHGANKIVKQLESAGIHAAAIHGNKSQAHRTRVLEGFKDGLLQILVATDIAARGIDIDQLPQVVNYDLPQVPEDYVHRIGRTGRAGATGHAISFACPDENKQLRDIERLLKRPITRATLPVFEVSQARPEDSAPATRPAERPAAAPARRPQARTKTQGGNDRPRHAAPARAANPSRSEDEANRQRPRRRRRSPSAGRQNKPNASGVTLLYRS
ncbi:MAG: DEAD/DEAH box helicase [Pseudomonadales bacterium]|nr:DEAD/DEAH box helicase [Pseudomonadales bacterium]MCP5330730.1 DEAD/DEAH box helicase [Pseudomonadales bacterium]MCP5345059.1 DEAD/DEAH box helicase [Pseudomonadales bacterium]